jgi:hypothetical protein
MDAVGVRGALHLVLGVGGALLHISSHIPPALSSRALLASLCVSVSVAPSRSASRSGTSIEIDASTQPDNTDNSSRPHFLCPPPPRQHTHSQQAARQQQTSGRSRRRPPPPPVVVGYIQDLRTINPDHDHVDDDDTHCRCHLPGPINTPNDTPLPGPPHPLPAAHPPPARAAAGGQWPVPAARHSQLPLAPRAAECWRQER